MPQLMGSYDENLLRDAPVATKQQLQEGYTTDLLASPSKSRSQNHNTQSSLPDGASAAIPPPALRNDLEQGQGFNNYNEKALSSTIPFWRTPKGIILIVALVIIIIGTVIGAAVGTSVHKSQTMTSNSTSHSPSPTSTGSTGDNGVGGGGSNSDGSGSVAPNLSSLLNPSPTNTEQNNPVGTQSPGRISGPNGFAMMQSDSNAVGSARKARDHNPRDVYQASGIADLS